MVLDSNMVIQQTKPHWQKKGSYGQRYNRDPFYNSKAWRKSRDARRLESTNVNGYQLLNIFCVDCYKETGKEVLGHNDDHIVAIKDGGDRFDYTNRQTLCDTHHAKKSAQEGNQRRKK